ncbi:MAG: EF-P lysine aminoacylase EpmA [Hyphomicrobiaceae bacterium]|nr:EF-P lysine aminoacylase EpmA [Hyphomicrobiaceae bacterium]
MPYFSPWWTPEVHADRRPFLMARGRIKTALRHWFTDQGFTEVEPGCLQVSPGNETHLHAFKTERTGTDLVNAPLYLHTSPEFACKKLLAAGETKIFTFTPAFRNRERGALHAPEFTMLEWYRTGETYEVLMRDCGDILRLACEAAGTDVFRYRARSCNPAAPATEITVADAFTRFANIDLLSSITPKGVNREALSLMADASGISLRADDNWADIFSKVLVERIEPQLGNTTPALLTEYPIAQAALARPDLSDPRIAERFELYACGVELANGFGELTDATVQRWRLEAEMEEKQRIYGERYPLDEDFLTALEMMPPASGCALGFDRLVMLATGADHIDKVLWTPLPQEAGGSLK